MWVNRGMEQVETSKNQGQLSFPPNVMKFGQQVGDTYTYAQSMSFCCHQFNSMELYTFLNQRSDHYS